MDEMRGSTSLLILWKGVAIFGELDNIFIQLDCSVQGEKETLKMYICASKMRNNYSAIRDEIVPFSNILIAIFDFSLLHPIKLSLFIFFALFCSYQFFASFLYWSFYCYSTSNYRNNNFSNIKVHHFVFWGHQ